MLQSLVGTLIRLRAFKQKMLDFAVRTILLGYKKRLNISKELVVSIKTTYNPTSARQLLKFQINCMKTLSEKAGIWSYMILRFLHNFGMNRYPPLLHMVKTVKEAFPETHDETKVTFLGYLKPADAYCYSCRSITPTPLHI